MNQIKSQINSDSEYHNPTNTARSRLAISLTSKLSRSQSTPQSTTKHPTTTQTRHNGKRQQRRVGKHCSGLELYGFSILHTHLRNWAKGKKIGMRLTGVCYQSTMKRSRDSGNGSASWIRCVVAEHVEEWLEWQKRLMRQCVGQFWYNRARRVPQPPTNLLQSTCDTVFTSSRPRNE